MSYWIAKKGNQYIAETDQFGNPIHTTNEKEAWKFNNFNTAMSYFNMGYSILKND